MPNAVLQNPVLIASIAAPALIMGVMAATFYQEVSKSKGVAMTKMRLRSDETLLDFRILFYFTSLEAIALFLIGTGALVQNTFMINIGRGLSAGVALVVALILYRWTKRVRK